jgi:type II secretory pathway component HofQ
MKFIMKIAGQPHACRRNPPIVGPAARPTATAAAKTPNACPRLSELKLEARMAADIGTAIANPTAITPRAESN